MRYLAKKNHQSVMNHYMSMSSFVNHDLQTRGLPAKGSKEMIDKIKALLNIKIRELTKNKTH